MLITTNQINLIKENKHDRQFKKSKKHVKQLFEDNFKTVQHKQAEELKNKIKILNMHVYQFLNFFKKELGV